MFGKVTVQIKLVEGDSAGTVTAFYVSLKLISLMYIFKNIVPVFILNFWNENIDFGNDFSLGCYNNTYLGVEWNF